MPATVKILWTKEEDDHLLALRRAGYKNSEIALSVGRPRSTVGHRITDLIRGLSDEEVEELKYSGEPPSVPPPTLRAEHISMKFDAAHLWTDELDARIVELRASGLSVKKVSELVGRVETTVYDRLIKLARLARCTPEEQKTHTRSTKYGSGRADYFRRPDGPPPDKPDVMPNPRAPAWRRCLGDACGRVFWSPNGGIRICTKCRHANMRTDGNRAESRPVDTPEFSLRF